MKEFISSVDALPAWAKLVLMIPFLDIFWWIYRIIRSIDSGNALCLVLSIVLLIVGIPFWWLVDIVYFLLKGKVLVFEDLL